MTKRELGALVLRVFSLYIVYCALNRFCDLGLFFTMWGDTVRANEEHRGRLAWALGTMGLSGIIYLVLGILVWMKADRLSRFLVLGDDTSSSFLTASACDLQVAAFSVVGLLILVKDVPLLVRSIFAIGSGRADTDIFTISSRVTQVCIGIWLFMGSRGVVNLLKRIRTRKERPGNREGGDLAERGGKE